MEDLFPDIRARLFHHGYDTYNSAGQLRQNDIEPDINRLLKTVDLLYPFLLDRKHMIEMVGGPWESSSLEAIVLVINQIKELSEPK